MIKFIFVLLSLQRYYWPVTIDALATGNTPHTHVAVTGRVAYCRAEADGDKHVKLMSTSGSGRFIIAEWIPKLPLAVCPAVGRIITVKGISRKDAEHLWWEVHPVESWS